MTQFCDLPMGYMQNEFRWNVPYFSLDKWFFIRIVTFDEAHIGFKGRLKLKMNDIHTILFEILE